MLFCLLSRLINILLTSKKSVGIFILSLMKIKKLINAFVAKHQFGFVGVKKMMISLTRNDFEPDICFF